MSPEIKADAPAYGIGFGFLFGGDIVRSTMIRNSSGPD